MHTEVNMILMQLILESELNIDVCIYRQSGDSNSKWFAEFIY